MIDTTRLRELRTDRGYSIRALADEVGVSYQTIRRLELGHDHGDLPLRVLGRIAVALGVPAAMLLADTLPESEPRPLGQQIGAIVAGTPGTTITAVAAALQVEISTVRRHLPGLAAALATAGLALARRGEALRIEPATPHARPETNTQPMNVNEARLLRRIERGTDVRRSLSAAERELTLPALARRGLVQTGSPLPMPYPALNRRPVPD